jgi:hypothetical protein
VKITRLAHGPHILAIPSRSFSRDVPITKRGCRRGNLSSTVDLKALAEAAFWAPSSKTGGIASTHWHRPGHTA